MVPIHWRQGKEGPTDSGRFNPCTIKITSALGDLLSASGGIRARSRRSKALFTEYRVPPIQPPGDHCLQPWLRVRAGVAPDASPPKLRPNLNGLTKKKKKCDSLDGSLIITRTCPRPPLDRSIRTYYLSAPPTGRVRCVCGRPARG